MPPPPEEPGRRPVHVPLGAAVEELTDPGALSPAGRASRAIAREGPLRVNLMVLGAGGRIAKHTAPGPISVHVVSGEITFHVGDERWSLGTGDLLVVPAGLEHEVSSAGGGAFVLTIAAGSTASR